MIPLKDDNPTETRSNTQPVIVCRFEADSKSSLNKIKNDIINKIKEISIQKDLILHV